MCIIMIIIIIVMIIVIIIMIELQGDREALVCLECGCNRTKVRTSTPARKPAGDDHPPGI